MLTAVALLLVSAAAVVQGTTYTVGDTTGWTVPDTATFYADWAANKTFVAGDALLFVYNKVGHNVLIVSSADYTSCTLTSTNKVQTGNDTITLVAGSNSFVCGIPGHCSGGQKLTVTATAAATPGTPNPITPPGPAPPTTTTPATTPTNAASAGTTVTVLQVLAAAMVSVVASLSI